MQKKSDLQKLPSGIAFVLFSLFFLKCLILNGQTPDFKRYSTSDGLITDEVYNLHQDNRGYIWVFSEKGTVKFNGREFKPVLKNLPFKDAFIYSIYENPAGRKWVANSNAKIYEVRNDSAIQIKGIEHISSSLKNSISEILKLVVDDSLNIYAITKGHSYKFTLRAGKYRPTELCTGMEENCVVVKTLKIQNEVLPVCLHFNQQQFYRNCRNGSTFIQFTTPQGTSNVQLPATYLQAAVRNMKNIQNYTCFSTHNFLYQVNPKSGEFIRHKINNALILNYTIDRNQHLWVGCYNDGLYELDKNGSIVNHYFPNNTINDVLVDHAGGLWVTTTRKGLLYCSDLDYKVYSPADPLGSTITILKEIDSSLFIGNGGGDIFRKSGDSMVRLRQADNNTSMDIEVQDGNYLVSNIFSVEKIARRSRKRTILSTFESSSFNRIIKKSEDTVIYMWRKGVVFAVNGRNLKQIDFGRKILTAELIGNNLWMGTEDGVFLHKALFVTPSQKIGRHLIIDKERLDQPAFLAETGRHSITGICKGNQNAIWLCTEGSGLIKIKDSILTTYTQLDGLPSNIINHVTLLGNNRLLLSTNRGLFLQDTSTGSQALKSWHPLYHGEVQKAIEFKGKIFASSSMGLIQIDVNSLAPDPRKVFFHLMHVKVDSAIFLPPQFKTVKKDYDIVEFIFDYVAFTENIPQFKYVLSGPVNETNIINTTNLKFRRLTPGDYTLETFPIIIGGEERMSKINFKVEPTFFQTPIYRIAVVLSLFALTSTIAWVIIWYYRQKAARKLKQQQLILEYKLIALKAQINPHFMSNCLSAIQGLVLSGKSERASYYIAQFGLMVRQILEFSNQHLVTLHEELELLGIYIELEKLRFENQFRYVLEVADNISARTTFVPPLILNPIVENAIWHGLLSIKNQKEAILHIAVTKKSGTIEITIADNGSGRAAQGSVRPKKGASHGIRITKQRLHNINYLYGYEHADILYSDLQDSEGKPAGTRVTIILPASLNPQEKQLKQSGIDSN